MHLCISTNPSRSTALYFWLDLSFIQLRDVTHIFRSLSRHKSMINPRFLVINKPSTPLHSGRMQLLVTFEPKRKFERGKKQPSGYSVYLPGTESEIKWHVVKNQTACLRTRAFVYPPEKSSRTTSLSPPSKSVLCMLHGLHLIFLGKAGASERHRAHDCLIRTHKFVTIDEISGRIENCIMQVPLKSSSDPSALD